MGWELGVPVGKAPHSVCSGGRRRVRAGRGAPRVLDKERKVCLEVSSLKVPGIQYFMVCVGLTGRKLLVFWYSGGVERARPCCSWWSGLLGVGTQTSGVSVS